MDGRTSNKTLICDECAKVIPSGFTRFTHHGGEPLCEPCWVELYDDPMGLEDDDMEDILKQDGDDEIDSFRYGYKSRLDPTQAPLEVRIAGHFEDLESKRDQYGRPWSRTAIMQQLEKRRKQEEAATEGRPWVLKR